MKHPDRESLVRALPAATRALLERLLEAAERRSLAVYLVGGPVRDFLLGRELRDLDLIVEGEGTTGAEALARGLAGRGVRTIVHGRFGTVRVEAQGGHIDLATVRSESYEHPGALPTVEAGGLEDDLRRRDFTLNALAIPLSGPARRGRPPLIDPDDGLRDLEAGVLRVFHPRSFHDDPTRALRAARFAARFGFRLSRGSRLALRDALRDGAFGRVSGERFRREFELIFEEVRRGGDPVRALRHLDEWHVLGGLEPGLGFPAPARRALRRLARALADPPWPEEGERPWVCGLCVWLAEVEAMLRRRVLRRLAIRGSVGERILEYGRRRAKWCSELAAARGRGAVDALLRRLDPEHRLALYAHADARLRRRIVRWASEDRARRPPVTGADLVREGLAGPAVGLALARIRAAYLDGRLSGREDALALAHEVARTAKPRKGRARSGRRGGPGRGGANV